MKIIAELCQNHNGNFDDVKRMVDLAAASGATHVKIQHIYAKNLVFRPQFEEGLEIQGGVGSIKRPWLPEHERLSGLELSASECEKFVTYAESQGVIPMTTCFTRGDVKTISEQGFKAVKVASYDCASYTLLRELSSAFDYLIVSTGATFDDEVLHAASVLKDNAKQFALLHCVTMYPTPLAAMHLHRLAWLKRLCSEVGFSDHSLVRTDGLIAAKAAIACGAEIIERHFTIADESATKDGPVSITPERIEELASFSRLSQNDRLAHLNDTYPQWTSMMGDEQRWLSDEELLNRDYHRGRFATPRRAGATKASEMIMNWEETPLDSESI